MSPRPAAPSPYRSRRCTSISDHGLRCQDDLGHTARRDRSGRRAAVLHHVVLEGRDHTWFDDRQSGPALRR